MSRPKTGGFNRFIPGELQQGFPYGWTYDRYNDPGLAWGLNEEDFHMDIRTNGVRGEGVHRGSRPEGTGFGHPAVRPCLTEWSSNGSPRGEVGVGNRIFAIPPAQVFDLFEKWGWEWKREAKHSDGHFYIWPATSQGVVICGPKAKRHERGNALAMKDAYRIMGLPSVQVFLAGPEGAQDREMSPAVDADGIDVAALERAQQQAASHVTNKEAAMAYTATGPDRDKGYSSKLREFFEEFQDLDVTLSHAHNHMLTHFPDISLSTVGALMNQMAKRETDPVIKVKRGVYRRPSDYFNKPEPVEAPVSSPPESSVTNETPAPAPVVEYHEQYTPTVVPSNGSTPDLLSKVATLDGGKFLFQGDDGALYVLRDVVRLNV